MFHSNLFFCGGKTCTRLTDEKAKKKKNHPETKKCIKLAYQAGIHLAGSRHPSYANIYRYLYVSSFVFLLFFSPPVLERTPPSTLFEGVCLTGCQSCQATLSHKHVTATSNIERPTPLPPPTHPPSHPVHSLDRSDAQSAAAAAA